MSSLMLIISFLLHIITLTAVYQLLQKVRSFPKQDDSDHVLQVMEVYLEEIRMENRRLEKLMMQEQNKTITNNHIEQKNVQNQKSVLSENNPKDETPELDKILNESPGYDIATSLESKILQLYNSGMSIDDIAKKLDCGKTEAELIVKLYQKQ